MPAPQFEDKKHPRDQGKFSPKPGQASAGDKPNWTSADPAMNPGEGAEKRQLIQPIVNPGQRDPAKLQEMGQHSASGYAIARKALEAFHGGGLSAMHHHGKAIQESIRMIKEAGAKPDELAKLRHGLGMLHTGVMTGDAARVHEALTNIQHGFYHAHGAAAKEHGGMGGFPMIGAGQAPEGDFDRMKRVGKKVWQDTVGTPGDRPWNKDLGKMPGVGDVAKGVGGMVKKIFSPGQKPKPAAAMRDEPIEEAPTLVQAPAQSPVVINFHTAPVTNGDPQAAERFKDAMMDTLKAQQPTPVNIVVPPPVVENKIDVKPTPINFEAKVEPAPVIQVNPTPVHIENKVEARPGEVKVTADVKMPERKPMRVEFTTDETGRLTGAQGK